MRNARPSLSLRPRLWARLRGWFLAGIVVVVPVALTLSLAVWAVGSIDRHLDPLVPAALNPGTWLGRDLPGIGIVAFVLLTTLAGILAKGFAGRRLVALAETQLARLPVIRSLYQGFKQMALTVFARSDRIFGEIGLVQLPGTGHWAVGFVAGPAPAELRARLGEPDLLSVFVPTTPNPTTGFTLYLPRREIRPTGLSLEDATKLVISVGLVGPRPVPPPA